MRIADVLRNKGAAVATISPDTTVTELLAGMAQHNIGAMVVMGPDGLVGIVSERDVVRRLNERGADLLADAGVRDHDERGRDLRAGRCGRHAERVDDREPGATRAGDRERSAGRNRQHRRRGEDPNGGTEGRAGAAADLHHPGRMTVDVRPSFKADVGELSVVLARAFHDDPVMMWMLPNVVHRARALPRMFATMTRHHFLPGGGAEVASLQTTRSAVRRCGIPPAGGRRRSEKSG